MGDDGFHIIGPIQDFMVGIIPRLQAVRMADSGVEVIFNRLIIDEVGEWADVSIAGNVCYGEATEGTTMIFDNPEDAMLCWLRWS